MTQDITKAPDFILKGVDNTLEEKEYSLSQLLESGKTLVFYTYPKDNTPGCTTEACNFRDNFNRLTNIATVVGISTDSIDSHKKFITKQELNFILLSDPDHKILESYGAWGEKKMYGKTYQGTIRSTFLIDKNGNIQKQWKNVKVKGHVEEILAELEH